MSKNPKTFVKKSGPVYRDSKLYLAGEPFTTHLASGEKPGEGWEDISPIEKIAHEASDPTVHNDPNLDEMTLDALQAIAAEKKVAITAAGKRLNKGDLITAIKAADEPKL